MKAIGVPRRGGPEVLELQESPDPAAGAGQIVVDVAAAGVNYRDIYEREGRTPTNPPLVAGIEGAGTVSAVGDRVTEFSPGDRVAWASGPGSYAERAAIDAGRAVLIPSAISDEMAAAAILQGMTAHYLACTTYPVQAGDTVLVHAAAGGVGLLLTQIVKMRGGRVIGTTSTDEKAELARAAGADEVIGYDGFGERVRELTDGQGVAAVYDGVGQATFDGGLAALRQRGVLAVYGMSSGPVPPFDTQRLMGGGSLYLTRPSLQHYAAIRSELLHRAEEVFGWIADGKLDVRIGGRYALANAAQAQSALESRATTGKLVLTPG